MNTCVIYMDMPPRVKAFLIINDDLSYTIATNKNSGLNGKELEVINRCLCVEHKHDTECFTYESVR